jgi:hypothetical protein
MVPQGRPAGFYRRCMAAVTSIQQKGHIRPKAEYDLIFGFFNAIDIESLTA